MIRVKWDRTGAVGSSQHEADDGDMLLVRQPQQYPPPQPRPHHRTGGANALASSGHRLGNSGGPRRRPPPPPVKTHGQKHHLPSPVRLYGNHGAIPEMDTICEVAAPPAFAPEWSHEVFRLNSKGQVTRRETNTKITKDEMRTYGEQLLRGLIEHVHNKMLREFQFVEQAIPALDDQYDGTSTVSMGSSYTSGGSSSRPSGATTGSSVRSSSSSICSTADGFRTMIDSDVPRCIFHTSENYRRAEKLLVFVCSSRGLSCGIWSRSLLLQEGVHVGSMIPYFRKAREAGYGILVMNPNMNTQTMVGDDGVSRKLPIEESSTQEEHCDHVWKNYIFPSAAHKIHFIAYGYGGLLVANLVEKYQHELKNRLGNVAFVESSHKVEPTWNDKFKRFFSQHSVCWKRSAEPLNVEIGTTNNTNSDGKMDSPRRPLGDDDASSTTTSSSPASGSGAPRTSPLFASDTFGCMCLSAGPDISVSDSPAYTTTDTLDTVFKFLATPSAYEFQRLILREVRMNALKEAEAESGGGDQLAATMNGLSTNSRRRGMSRGDRPAAMKEKETVTVDDFQLLRVVGRGAFGKVMLVRKKKSSKRALSSRGLDVSNYPGSSSSSSSSGSNSNVYAMKVIKKAAVFAKNQVEHTKTERRVLEGVDHPFAVKLRYAFQTEAKLFFVMDYYNGGTLHFHLKQSRRFTEERARFYAAQVVLALAHLHTYNVVYRDLKPENILMDDAGFIAITDFGLSSDHFDAKGEGLKTFCGTPEYIAPELIRRQPYGKAVDYWSLGVMVFEMIAGFTPFFNSNRKRNFENIVRMPLRFPTETFSEDVKSFLRGLMTKDPAKRLGSGPMGPNEIKDHPFFASIDWERLYKREVSVPFKPMVKKDGELTNIPEFFKRQDVMDSAPDQPAPIGQRNEFKGFTYVDPLPM